MHLAFGKTLKKGRRGKVDNRFLKEQENTPLHLCQTLKRLNVGCYETHQEDGS